MNSISKLAVVSTCNDNYIPKAIVAIRQFLKLNPNYDPYIICQSHSRDSRNLCSLYKIGLLTVDLSSDFHSLEARPYGQKYPIECFYHFYSYLLLNRYSYIVAIESDMYTNKRLTIDFRKIGYIGGSVNTRKLNNGIVKDYPKLQKVYPNLKLNKMSSIIAPGFRVYCVKGLEKINFYRRIVDLYQTSIKIGAPRCGDDTLMQLYQRLNPEHVYLLETKYCCDRFIFSRRNEIEIFHLVSKKWWRIYSTNNKPDDDNLDNYFYSSFQRYLHNNFPVQFIQRYFSEIAIGSKNNYRLHFKI